MQEVPPQSLQEDALTWDCEGIHSGDFDPFSLGQFVDRDSQRTHLTHMTEEVTKLLELLVLRLLCCWKRWVPGSLSAHPFACMILGLLLKPSAQNLWSTIRQFPREVHCCQQAQEACSPPRRRWASHVSTWGQQSPFSLHHGFSLYWGSLQVASFGSTCVAGSMSPSLASIRTYLTGPRAGICEGSAPLD